MKKKYANPIKYNRRCVVIRHGCNLERVTPLFLNEKNSITPSEVASEKDLTGVVWVGV